MKTAISIPGGLFREVEACTRRLTISRSRLFTDAAREHLARRRAPVDATQTWNEAIAAADQPGDEAGAVALRRRGNAVRRAALKKRR